jgi:hypothetical protein
MSKAISVPRKRYSVLANKLLPPYKWAIVDAFDGEVVDRTHTKDHALEVAGIEQTKWEIKIARAAIYGHVGGAR